MKTLMSCCIIVTLWIVTGIVPLASQDSKEREKKDEKTAEQKIEESSKSETPPQEKKEEKTAAEQKAELKKKTSDYTIGEIIVRSKTLASVQDASLTTELTSESLRSRSEKTLDQALETVPGMIVKQGKKGQMNFNMWGFQHNTIALLVDGLPFEEIYDGGGGDISRILVMNASKIVVNRGTSSALYGSRGTFGSINVITKKPERLFFDGGAEFDQYGGFSVNASGGGTYNNFYFLLSASAIKSNSYQISNRLNRNTRLNWMNRLVPWYTYGYTPETAILTPVALQYVMDGGMWNHTDAIKYYTSGKIGYAVTKNIELGVSTNYYQGEFNFNGFETSSFSSYLENGTWNVPNSGSMFQNRAWHWPKDYRLNVAPYLTLDFGDFNMKAIYYYTIQKNILEGWTNQAQTALFDRGKYSEHDEESNGFYVYPSYKFAAWNKLSGMIHYRMDEFNRYKKRIGVYAPTSGSGANPNYNTPWFKTALMTAKYIDIGIEDEFKFKTGIGDIKFSLGLSYDAQMLSRNYGGRYAPGNTAILNEDITGFLRPRVKTNPTSSIWGTGDSFNPVVALLYEPVKETLKIRSTFSSKVKFPTLHEYADTGDLVDQYFFSPSTQEYLPLVIKLNQILPETAYNASCGAELTLFDKALSLREDYFYSFYRNKLVSIGDPNSNVGNKRWTNIEGSEVHGIESTIGSNLGTDRLKVVEMNVSATYVFTTAKNWTGSHAIQGERVEQVPAHQVIFQVKWDFICGTSLNIWSNSMFNQIVYIQKWPTSLLGSPSVFTSQVYSARRIHDPFMLNIKVNQRLFDHFDLWVMCKNVTDDYSADPFNPGPGRSLYFGCNAEF